jgi:hypothetical protein
MKTTFAVFFFLIALAGILSVADSWLIQYQQGGIGPGRALFQACVLALILYLLSGRSIPGYILAVCYAVGNAALYGYELSQFFLFGNPASGLPTGVVILSGFLIASATSAVVVLGADYIDYRRRRVSDQ